MGRPSLLALLAAAALLTTACGSPAPSGKAAAKVVKGDWEFNHSFKGAHANLAAYDTVDAARCTPQRHGRFTCVLTVSGANRHPCQVNVVVDYDSHGVVAGWDLAAPATPHGRCR